MKCLCCDKILSDSEATRKYPDTNTFLDTCNGCISASDIPNIMYIEELPDEEDLYKDDHE